jgi:hypothetical protein
LLLFLCGTAQATVFQFTTELSGPAEFPPNASPGTGTGLATYDNVAHTLRIEATFSGLEGPTTVSHIHGPTAVPGAGAASVATTTPTFPGFPAGVTAGSYDHTLDLTLASSYNAPFLANAGGSTAAAEIALINAIQQGRAYLNIHSSRYPGGEIRGFYRQVPDTATTAPLLLAAIGALAGFARLKRSQN